MNYKLLILIVLVAISTHNSFSQDKPVAFGSLVDPRDNKTYKTIVLGNQEWMAENLNYATESKSWYYDNSDSLGAIYGRLYCWDEALNACPAGWSLPSDEEWKILERHLGIPDSTLNVLGYIGTDQGTRLKAGGDTGFNVLMGGYYFERWVKSFYYIGQYATFWTSTSEDEECAFIRDFSINDPTIFRNSQSKNYMRFSVRCIKN
jgi:uncharacterized protein (TIGR02145 family)